MVRHVDYTSSLKQGRRDVDCPTGDFLFLQFISMAREGKYVDQSHGRDESHAEQSLKALWTLGETNCDREEQERVRTR